MEEHAPDKKNVHTFGRSVSITAHSNIFVATFTIHLLGSDLPLPLPLPLPTNLCTPTLWPKPHPVSKTAHCKFVYSLNFINSGNQRSFYGRASFPPATVLSADLVGTLRGAYKWTSLQSGLCKVPQAASTAKSSLCSFTTCDAGGQEVREGGFLCLPPNQDQPASI